MIRLAPPYTSVEAVRAELPKRLGSDGDAALPEGTILQKIQSRANFIDSKLALHYLMPVRALQPDPACNPEVAGMNPIPFLMPTLLEEINRFLAVEECLVNLRDLRHDEESNKKYFEDRGMSLLEDLQQGRAWLMYPFTDCETGGPTYVPLNPNSPLYSTHPLHADDRARYSFPARTFTRETWGVGRIGPLSEEDT